jgi:hypothetical protein
VVRSDLAGIRVEKATRQAVPRWYRLPRDLAVEVVELRGIELDGQELGALEEEAIPLPQSRRSRNNVAPA